MTEVLVSLACTTRDEAETIGPFLASIDAQTRRPDEVVIVDGGSVDGTLEMLRAWADGRTHTTVVSLPGANIARGRSTAVAMTHGEVIATTDAGCVLHPYWLERLVARLGAADVAMGYYEPLCETRFERISTCLTVPDAVEIHPERFMPSARSVAFRRHVWDRAGPYPAWLDVGEDMSFDFRVRALAMAREFVPDAIVRWRPRGSLRAFLRQYFRYAKGDGIARMYTHRHAVRFAAYGGALAAAALSVRWPWLVAIPGALAGLWLVPAWRRAYRRTKGERLVAFLLIPVLAAAMDAAKMAGYLSGRMRRRPTR